MASPWSVEGHKKSGVRSPDSCNTRRAPLLTPGRLFSDHIKRIMKDKEKDKSSPFSICRSAIGVGEHMSHVSEESGESGEPLQGTLSDLVSEGIALTFSSKSAHVSEDSPRSDNADETEVSSVLDETSLGDHHDLALDEIPLPSSPQDSVPNKIFGLELKSPEDSNNNTKKNDRGHHKNKIQERQERGSEEKHRSSAKRSRSKERRPRNEEKRDDYSHSRKWLFPLKSDRKRESPDRRGGAFMKHSRNFRNSPEKSYALWKKLKVKQEEKSEEKLPTKMKSVRDYQETSSKALGSLKDEIKVRSVPHTWCVERMPTSDLSVKCESELPVIKELLRPGTHCVGLSDALVDVIPTTDSSDEDRSVKSFSCAASSQDCLKFAGTEASSSVSSVSSCLSGINSSSHIVPHEVESSASGVNPNTYQKDKGMLVMPPEYYVHTPPPPIFQPGSYPWRPNMQYTSSPLSSQGESVSLGASTVQTKAILHFATAVEARYKCLQNLHTPPKPNFYGYQLIGDSLLLRFAQKILGESPILAENLRFLGLCVSGQRVGELLKRLKNDFYHIGKKVVVLIGTNDLLRNTSLEQMCAELQKVVKYLRARAEQVVLLTLPPIPRLESMSYHWSRLHGYNSFIKQLSSKDSGVSVSDIFPLYVRTRDEMEEEELVAEYNAKNLLCYGCLLCSNYSDLDLQECDGDSDLDDTGNTLDIYCDPDHIKYQDITSMFHDKKISKCRSDCYEMYFADSNRKDLIHLNYKGLHLVKDHLFKVLE